MVQAGFFQRRERFGTQLAFHFTDTFPVPHPTAIYRPGGALRAFLVLMPPETREPLQVKGEILFGEEVLHKVDQEFTGGTRGQPALMAFEIGLRSSLMPGAHRLELELSSGQKRSLPFTVELGPELIPPLVNSPAEAPNTSGLWNVERAKQHIALGQNLAALESLENAIERTPELESARLQLGVLALGLGQPERALNGIVPGLMNDPFHYDMLVLAGYASEQLGQLDQAVKYYERARAAEQADEKLLRALASLYEKLGEMDKAAAVRQEISS
jgi:tetratricopeptide (TPR) repeat protein